MSDRNAVDTPKLEPRARHAARAVRLGAMFKWFARVVLLRFLPRRLLPILTAVQIFRMLRGMRNRQGFAVNEPTDSRTAPPPSLPAASRRR